MLIAIVRLKQPEGSPPVYVLVNLKYRAGKFPKDLIKNKRVWRFKLERAQPVAESIYEYLIQTASSHAPEKRWSIWRLVPGAEHEKLPFEQKLRSYTLVKNGIKLMK